MKKKFDEYKQEIIRKLENKEEFSESELSKLVDFEIEREYGDECRWTVAVSSIIRLNDKFYCLDWDKGKTENQENEFYYQPYEVEKKEYDKVIHVVEWVAK